MVQYITTKEICDIYKVSRQTVYNWRDNGLPFIYLGTAVRFDAELVHKWLMENGSKTKRFTRNKKL